MRAYKIFYVVVALSAAVFFSCSPKKSDPSPKPAKEDAVTRATPKEKLPFKKAEDRMRFLSRGWTEMGGIQASLGRTAVGRAAVNLNSARCGRRIRRRIS